LLLTAIVAAVALAFVLAFICGVRTDLMTAIGTVVLAIGTLVLAFVAIFADTVRYKPILEVSIDPEPPNCIAIPLTIDGTPVAASYYLRLWVKNTGNTVAKLVEVYASELLRRRPDNISWGSR
jgi:NO-binding membrane sensor protein with MHYT domain